jgi:ribosome modulation factor
MTKIHDTRGRKDAKITLPERRFRFGCRGSGEYKLYVPREVWTKAGLHHLGSVSSIHEKYLDVANGVLRRQHDSPRASCVIAFVGRRYIRFYRFSQSGAERRQYVPCRLAVDSWSGSHLCHSHGDKRGAGAGGGREECVLQSGEQRIYLSGGWSECAHDRQRHRCNRSGFALLFPWDGLNTD